MALNKPLESIEESDLQALVDNQVSERKTIEYKAALPGNADGDKKEFLADVSSFANAAGGHLIFGIKEQSGVPIELCGLQIDDVNAEILRLEGIIQTGIAPRLFRMVEVKEVSLPSKRQLYAIVIHIRKSWISPHMVTFQNNSKFFTRDSRGKHQLDVSELRTAFVLSETTVERIRNFRTERLSNIIAGETPTPLNEKAPKLVLHIVPFSAFDPAARVDLNSLRYTNIIRLIEPLTLWSGYYPTVQHNFDGLLSPHWPNPAKPASSYVQIFRNGSIEAVDTSILGASGEKRIFSGETYERKLLEYLSKYLGAQKHLRVEPPLYVMVSLLGVAGYSINMGTEAELRLCRINRPSNLIVPEVMIDDFGCVGSEVMKPIFDMIWNAAGWERSMNYDDVV